MKRLRSKLLPKIDDRQFGFKKGKGTRNAVFVMTQLSERAIEMSKDIYLTYIYYEKAFDRVKHDTLFREFGRTGVYDKNLRLLKNLSCEKLTTIGVGKNHSTGF